MSAAAALVPKPAYPGQPCRFSGSDAVQLGLAGVPVLPEQQCWQLKDDYSGMQSS